MAAKEMWDYLATGVTANSTNTLDLTARGLVRERGSRNQIVHLADDDSEEVISFDTRPTFFISVPWSAMDEADAGTVMDFWGSTSKGDGIAKRFHFVHAYGTQTHNYTVRFNKPLTRNIRAGNIHGAAVELKVLGRSTI